MGSVSSRIPIRSSGRSTVVQVLRGRRGDSMYLTILHVSYDTLPTALYMYFVYSLTVNQVINVALTATRHII